MNIYMSGDDSPLIGPLRGHTASGDAALFEDQAGNLVARVTIMPCIAVPTLVLTHPDKAVPHPDPVTLTARCPLLEALNSSGYSGWDDPVFRDLCRQFGLDPAKQRPTFDAWCRDVGEALLDCAVAAFGSKHFDVHAAAGGAAEMLKRGVAPDSVALDRAAANVRNIPDPSLRERTERALAQLARSADWQDGLKHQEAEAMRDLIEAARVGGTPVTFHRDPDGPGGVVVIGDLEDEPARSWAMRARGWVQGWMHRLRE